MSSLSAFWHIGGSGCLLVHAELSAVPCPAGTVCHDRFGQTQRCNQDVYGMREPPVYDLSQIKIPIALFSGALHQAAQ